MKKNAFLLFAAMLVTIFACRKDIDEVTTEETNFVPPILEKWEQPVAPVTGTLIVFVTNEAGAPVPDAKVKLGNLTLSTDQYGHAFFRDANMNAEGTFIKVENEAYFTGSRRFFPVDGAKTRVRVELIAKQFDHSFASQDGGVVELNGGASITFPENSIRKANGTAYNGTVKLAAHWLDPTQPSTLDRMPGNLQGINNQGTEMVLATYGMVVAELEDENGNPLNILKGKTATIKMPVPTSQLASAPAEIPLWSYYEDYGVWAEEGKATLQNGVYVGEVSHFSFWNCDYPFPNVNFTATFVDDSGAPLVNYLVALIPSVGAMGMGVTDNTGTTSGRVPKDMVFELQILDQCYQVVYTSSIGPFTDDVDLGQVVVPNSLVNPTILSGQLVDCNNQPVANGLVIIEFDGRTWYEYTSTSNFDISFSACNFNGDGTVIGVDLDALLQSSPITVTAGITTNLGQISTCNAQLENYISVTVDGVTEIYSPVFNNPDSSGNGGSSFVHFDALKNTFVSISIGGQAIGSYNGAGNNFLYEIYDLQNGWSIKAQAFDLFEITEYGPNIGDKIKANFSGTMTNTFTQPPQTVNVSGSFNINRGF